MPEYYTHYQGRKRLDEIEWIEIEGGLRADLASWCRISKMPNGTYIISAFTSTDSPNPAVIEGIGPLEAQCIIYELFPLEDQVTTEVTDNEQ